MRRRVVVIAAFACVAVGTAVACSFPDVTFDDTLDASTDQAAGGDAMMDGPAVGDGGSDAPILLDGSDPDALIVRDSGGPPIDASDCTSCDCDHDGFNVTSRPGCEGGLNDCDDSDPRANPNQGYLVDEAGSPLFGDWNCSTKVDYLYPNSFACSNIAVADCASAAGFSAFVGCAAFGTLTRCKLQGLPGLQSCVTATTQNNTQQACK